MIDTVLKYEQTHKKHKVEFTFIIEGEIQFFIAHYLDKYIFVDKDGKKLKECTSEKMKEISDEFEGHFMKKAGWATNVKKTKRSIKSKS